MNRISFMTANFVARELDYDMPGGWGQGDRATNSYFRPEETFAERFEALLQEIVAMDFDTIDLWLAHLNAQWATEGQVETATALLEKYGLAVASLAGWFGETREEFERCCRLAVALDCSVLGGSTSILEKDRDFAVEMLRKYQVRLGLENHPEKTPQVMLEKIGDGADGVIGVTVDTGWFGTQGYDAAQAIRELESHVVHVHLKDVLAEGEHETCAYGEGIVPIEDCVRALQEIGYEGVISVEHEPEHEDPKPGVAASRAKLEGWLKGSFDRFSEISRGNNEMKGPEHE